MYVNTAFRGTLDDAKALLLARGFGILVAHDGATVHASHIPFLYHEDGASLGRIAFHVAKPNPLHRIFASHPAALLICQGPDAYVSPDWYKSDDQVPTWNYITVHVAGTVRIIDQTHTRAHLDALSAHFESRLAPKKPWTMDKMTPRKIEAMLKGIVALEMDIAEITPSWKLGQQKDDRDREGAIAGLQARSDEASRAIAELMERALRG
jgi:transcriptional regulator